MIRIKDVTAMMTQCLIDISHASKATPRLSRARKYRLSRADVVFKLKAVATCNVEHELDYSGLPAKLSQMMLLEMSDDKSIQGDIIDVQIGELALTACACACASNPQLCCDTQRALFKITCVCLIYYTIGLDVTCSSVLCKLTSSRNATVMF